MSEFPPVPGLQYHSEFVSSTEEHTLIAAIETLRLAPATFHGFTARRRIVHFESEVPEFLLWLRDRAAVVAGVDAEQFTKALVTEYAPGAVIGWHRDAPPYGPVVIGISLGGACRMRFRKAEKAGGQVMRQSLALEPRSLYVLAGPARSEWQHSIPAVPSLRYSVTFRSLRAK